jgi:hypothetical protein
VRHLLTVSSLDFRRVFGNKVGVEQSKRIVESRSQVHFGCRPWFALTGKLLACMKLFRMLAGPATASLPGPHDLTRCHIETESREHRFRRRAGQVQTAKRSAIENFGVN